jgi:hypothetical protein
MHWRRCVWLRTYVYLAILETLLQVIVDRFVRYFADEGQIGDTNFLLLCRVECSLLDVGLATAGGTGATTRLRITGGLVALWSPADSLIARMN